MNTSPLDVLLDKLCSGDAAAAEQAFLEYEPYLRKVVRRLLPQRLRAKFDSVDIVQSAWSDLWQGFRDAGWRFANANQLRAFLVRATRNRFIDRYRQLDPLVRQEEKLAGHKLEQIPAAAQATPSALAQAGDLWQRLLELCPPEYQPILRMKRQGVPMEEIAAQTGLHPGSIRRILRQLACQLAGEAPPHR
jgi:RNA polymerase sigma-70 factor (ECF subfamily)